MIARRWRAWVATERAASAAAYLQATGVDDALSTPGNRGALLVRREVDGRVELELTTLWGSEEAVRAFAGTDDGSARLYPDDAQHFDEWESTVEHLDVISFG